MSRTYTYLATLIGAVCVYFITRLIFFPRPRTVSSDLIQGALIGFGLAFVSAQIYARVKAKKVNGWITMYGLGEPTNGMFLRAAQAQLFLGPVNMQSDGKAMRIILRNTDKAPIYEQIKEQIKEATLSEALKEGDPLPSIRQLARDLKISVITTTRAYTDLEQEGFIAIQQGRGCFVLPKNSEIVREQLLRKIKDHFTAAVSAGKIARLTRGEIIAMLEFILEEVQFEL